MISFAVYGFLVRVFHDSELIVSIYGASFLFFLAPFPGPRSLGGFFLHGYLPL